MSSLLDDSCALTKEAKTGNELCLENFQSLAEKQQRLFRDVDVIASYPRQLYFHALLGRAVCRVKLGLPSQSQSDIQEALHLRQHADE